jgi:uncharacterized LabA/DUF88 family protein
VLRTACLVDGFNLYHSLCDAQRDYGTTTKWLDLAKLCNAFRPIVAGLRNEPATVVGIYYFSAMPTHRPADQQARHTLYMRCLVGTGVHVSLSQFKRHKEKETDVAMASRLFEICYEDEADCIVLVTGDTDLAPAIRTCQRLFPAKTLVFALPYRRANDELRRLAPGSFKIRAKTYFANQFSDPLVLPDGTTIAKPSSW